MSDENKRIIEVNGVKLEVDLTQAKRVDHFRVGDRVRVLVKRYSSWETRTGVIVGFDAFEAMPTINVAYLTEESSEPLRIVHIHSESKDVEICPAGEGTLLLERNRVRDLFARQIAKLQGQIDDLEQQRAYFERRFGSYFGETEVEA